MEEFQSNKAPVCSEQQRNAMIVTKKLAQQLSRDTDVTAFVIALVLDGRTRAQIADALVQNGILDVESYTTSVQKGAVGEIVRAHLPPAFRKEQRSRLKNVKESEFLDQLVPLIQWEGEHNARLLELLHDPKCIQARGSCDPDYECIARIMNTEFALDWMPRHYEIQSVYLRVYGHVIQTNHAAWEVIHTWQPEENARLIELAHDPRLQQSRGRPNWSTIASTMNAEFRVELPQKRYACQMSRLRRSIRVALLCTNHFHSWSPEQNARLFELVHDPTCAYREGTARGRPNYSIIASVMNQEFGLTFSPKHYSSQHIFLSGRIRSEQQLASPPAHHWEPEHNARLLELVHDDAFAHHVPGPSCGKPDFAHIAEEMNEIFDLELSAQHYLQQISRLRQRIRKLQHNISGKRNVWSHAENQCLMTLLSDPEFCHGDTPDYTKIAELMSAEFGRDLTKKQWIRRVHKVRISAQDVHHQ